MELEIVKIEKIAQLIRSGLSAENACLAHGLKRKEIETLAKDEEFLEIAAQADAQGQAIMFQRIMAVGGWVGAKWILEFKAKQQAQAHAERMAQLSQGRSAIRINTTKSQVQTIEYDPDLE
jgi:hypothetical protein